MNDIPKRIILASSSPRRYELMQRIGLPFEVMHGSVDEDAFDFNIDPVKAVCAAANAKVAEIAVKVQDGVIIGADTIVLSKGRVFGKPEDEADAVDMLESLSGCDHEVITGIAVMDAASGRRITDYEKTKVYFFDLDRSRIRSYVLSGEPFGKAGAYAIQGRGALFVKRVEGCFFNVVGLPIGKLALILENFDIHIFN